MNENSSEKKIDFYASIAPFYDVPAGAFLGPSRKEIVRSAKLQKCRRILDVACGTGEQAIMLAKSGIDTAGIDLSPAMLGVARQKRHPGVAYFMGNAEDLPFALGSFDCITISLALHEMAQETRTKTIYEMLRVLTPDGKLMAFDYASMENWISTVGLVLLGLPERVAGGEHFRNFVRFVRRGGINRFFNAFPLEIIESRSYFLGALRLVILQKIH